MVALVMGVPACGKSSGSGLTCGSGTRQQGNDCVAVADGGGEDDAGSPGVDAAGDVTTDASADGGPASGPTFAGITAVAPVSATELLATWKPGSDAAGTSALRYRLYVAPSGESLSYATPAVQTAAGAVSAVLVGLQTNAAYVVGVRAVDPAGNEDENAVTMTGSTAADTMPPTFGGLTGAVPSGSGAIQLSWSPATDDLSPAAALTYLVYEGTAAGGEDFSSPALVSGPGATSVEVTRLGTATQDRFFVVRARDAAGNVDTNAVELSSKPSPDTVPPQFSGCAAAVNAQAVTLAVSWAPAFDDVSDPPEITYDIYASTTPGTYDFTRPFAVVKGVDVASIPALQPSTRYSFVCRAKDEAGNEDTNLVEVSAQTGANPTPPTFAGITSLTGDPVARTATLGWSPATDPSTPQSAIVYDVYVAETSGGEAFSKPPFATSAAGATSTTVSGLPSNTTVYVVVRARDASGNHDGNLVEKSMATNASFSLDVQSVLTKDCGVVGCHVPGNPTGGLILAPGFAYAQIVDVPAGEMNGVQLDGGTVNYITPGDPADSYLNIKINAGLLAALKASLGAAGGRTGSQMPAPSTGSTLTTSELTAIATWIQQGAPNN
jgi:hypothetical protein